MVLARRGKLGMLGAWKQGCAWGGCGAGEEAERLRQPLRQRAGNRAAARDGAGRQPAAPGVGGRATERLGAATVAAGGSLAPARGCPAARVSHGGTEAAPGHWKKSHRPCPPCPQRDRNSLGAGKGPFLGEPLAANASLPPLGLQAVACPAAAARQDSQPHAAAWEILQPALLRCRPGTQSSASVLGAGPLGPPCGGWRGDAAAHRAPGWGLTKEPGPPGA